MKITYFYIIFLLTTNLYAQISISGNVSDQNKNCLIGASVLLLSKKDTTKILNYSITDDKGNFLIHIKKVEFDNILKISYLGFEDTIVNISKDIKFYKITLNESDNKLEEVVVKAQTYKDTIRLKNNTIKFSKNANLKKLLKDNEGIEITDDNGIKYMGVPINKILINNKEVFVNQNSLALENITNEMIDNIQVINNYKNKFNVGFDNFNETVINIHVKKKFKGVLKNIFELSGGIENAYSIKWKSFLFSDKLNVFLTQNTNSISDKNRNRAEILNRNTQASNFYTENITSMAEGKEQIEKDFYNNSDLLIKKEYKKSKIESKIGFNYSKQKIENSLFIDSNQNKISEENIKNSRKGAIFYTDIGFTSIIGNNTSLNLNTSIDLVKNDLNWLNHKKIFPYTETNFNTDYISANKIIKGGLNLKKIINQNWLLENSFKYAHEKTNNNFLKIGNRKINQDINYTNNNFILSSSLFYQYHNLLNFGVKTSFLNSNEFIHEKTQRNLRIVESYLILRGQNSKWNYFANVGTKYFTIKDDNFNTNFLPVSASLNYKLSSKKSIHVSYERNYRIENIENSLDSIFVNSTSLVTSNKKIKKNIEQKQSLIISYNLVNISKSKNFSILTSASLDKNFSEISLLNINSVINTFRRTIFKKRKSIYVKNSYSKGYYFSKNDHKIHFGYAISGTLFDSNIISNNALKPFISNAFSIEGNIAFIPQELFFSELIINSNYSKNNVFVDGFKVNSVDFNNTSFLINKISDKYMYSVEFYNNMYNSKIETIRVNDFNLSGRYYLNSNMSFYVKGLNILNLIKKNKNKGNLTSNSVNGFNIITINNNIFSYLVAGVQFKI